MLIEYTCGCTSHYETSDKREADYEADRKCYECWCEGYIEALPFDRELTEKHQIKEFLFQPNAAISLHSSESGKTFRYSLNDKGEVSFVAVLDDSGRHYLGTIFEQKRYFHGKKSKLNENEPCAKAFAWFWHHLNTDAETMPEGLVVELG